MSAPEYDAFNRAGMDITDETLEFRTKLYTRALKPDDVAKFTARLRELAGILEANTSGLPGFREKKKP